MPGLQAATGRSIIPACEVTSRDLDSGRQLRQGVHCAFLVGVHIPTTGPWSLT